MTAKRYVIRVRDDATQTVDQKYVPHVGPPPRHHGSIGGHYTKGRQVPHPRRGWYIMDGGHLTEDFQEAQVFRADSKRGRAFHASVHEKVPVVLSLADGKNRL